MEANTVKLKELRAIKAVSFDSIMRGGIANVQGKISMCVGSMKKRLVCIFLKHRTKQHFQIYKESSLKETQSSTLMTASLI